MHPDAHVKIAKKVAIDIGRADLSPTLEYYSVIPDKWRDFPHHTGGRGTKRIARRVLHARNNYIQGYDNKAAAELGVAFHYIADEHVLVTGSDNRHVSYESKISRVPLYTQNIDSIEGKDATLKYINEKMSELRSNQYLLTPEVALNSAYKMCASIAKSVFGSKTSPDLLSILTELRETYVKKMRDEEERFVNKLIETARKDEALENSKGLKRIINKIKKALTLFDFRFRRDIRKYIERKHLQKVVKSYYREADFTSEPYKGWYLFHIPELFVFTEEDVVKRTLIKDWTKEVAPKLLTVKSIMKEFILDEQRINELKEKTKISIIKLKDEEFIKKEDFLEIGNLLFFLEGYSERCASKLLNQV